MCVGVLRAYMSIYTPLECLVPSEASEVDTLRLELQLWVLRIKPRSLGE